MANVDSPFGFRPVYDARINTRGSYTIASGYGTTILPDDPVKNNAGNIERAADGDTILGFFVGCTYVEAAGTPKTGHWPASTVTQGAKPAEALVYDEPKIKAVVQVNGGTLTAADRFKLADSVAGAGNVQFQRSGFKLSSTVGTGSATYRILDLYDSPDNAWGANARVVVEVHEHDSSIADNVT